MITAISNSKIKRVRDLINAKKHREREHKMVIEGVRLSEETLRANVEIDLCLYSENLSERGKKVIDRIKENGYNLENVSPVLMERISDTVTSQGILLVVPYPDIPLGKKIDSVIVLDRIQDPGNLGTILRTAAAMDIDAAFLIPGTADPFAPKVMRAAMGAQFYLPIQYKGAQEIFKFCKRENTLELMVVLADMNGTSACWDADLTAPICLVIGSEAQGFSDNIKKMSNASISIPMGPQMESLNASIAASILLYELKRQRMKK